MPVIKCKTCERITNTACSNAFTKKANAKFGEATECYAAFNEQEQKWEKGCGFDALHELDKHVFGSLFKKKGV